MSDRYGPIDGAAPTAPAPFPDPGPEVLAAIAARHGLIGPVERLVSTGLVNAVWAIGDAVVRIPRDDVPCLAETAVEGIVAPYAAAVGVRGPRLLAYDDRRDLVAVPYTVWTRARGRPLGHLRDPVAAVDVWCDVAREIARFHAADPRPDDPRLPEEAGPDLDAILAGATEAMRPAQADWVAALGARLAVGGPTERRLLHDDLHQMNLLVEDGALTAILDWGDAGWGDPALEFACFPLRVVPAALRAYREVRALPDEVIPRILRWHLAITVDVSTGRHAPPPASRWIEWARFVAEERDPAWRDWL